METKKEEAAESKYVVTVHYPHGTERIENRDNLEKKKITTYLLFVYQKIFREMSDETGISMTRLMNQAVDEFLQKIGRIDGPLTPPINTSYLRLEEEMEPRDE